MASADKNVERAFVCAKEQYSEWGVNVETAITQLSTIAI